MPLSLLGCLYYLAVALLVLAGRHQALRWLTLAGALVSLGLLGVQAFVLHAFCSLCCVSAVCCLLLAGLAWRRPQAAAATGAVLAIPAFWNFAEAAGLLWIVLAAAWAWASLRGGSPRRCLTPLLAGPLALVGPGPASLL